MRRRMRDGRTFVPALFALVLLCILFLVVLGSSLYASVVRSSKANSAARASLSYVCAHLRAADEAEAVQIGTGPEGDMLILREPLENTGYETQIYLYDGQLMEGYLPSGSAADPAAATAVADTAQFAVSLDGQEVHVTTGEGTARVFLHSGAVQP